MAMMTATTLLMVSCCSLALTQDHLPEGSVPSIACRNIVHRWSWDDCWNGCNTARVCFDHIGVDDHLDQLYLVCIGGMKYSEMQSD